MLNNVENSALRGRGVRKPLKFQQCCGPRSKIRSAASPSTTLSAQKAPGGNSMPAVAVRLLCLCTKATAKAEARAQPRPGHGSLAGQSQVQGVGFPLGPVDEQDNGQGQTRGSVQSLRKGAMQIFCVSTYVRIPCMIPSLQCQRMSRT